MRYPPRFFRRPTAFFRTDSYDRAITVFSPDGHLFQVEYAMEAVKKGTSVVSVRGEDVVVLGVEKKSIPKLQDPKTLRKIVKIDEHIYLAFAGLNADARILIDRARVECQSYRLSVEVAPTVEYLARYVAKIQQQYTQKGGRRPFGISMFIGGVDRTGPQLYLTDPSGSFSSWKANAVGRNDVHLREVLEKKWKEHMTESECLDLTVQTLGEMVENGGKSMELIVMTANGVKFVKEEEVEEILARVGAAAVAGGLEEA